MPQNDPRKAARWWALVDGGTPPDAATAQVEREFAVPVVTERPRTPQDALAGPPRPVEPQTAEYSLRRQTARLSHRAPPTRGETGAQAVAEGAGEFVEGLPSLVTAPLQAYAESLQPPAPEEPPRRAALETPEQTSQRWRQSLQGRRASLPSLGPLGEFAKETALMGYRGQTEIQDPNLSESERIRAITRHALGTGLLTLGRKGEARVVDVVGRRRALADLTRTRAELDRSLGNLTDPEVLAARTNPLGEQPARLPGERLPVERPEGYQPVPLNFQRRAAVPEAPRPVEPPPEVPSVLRAPEPAPSAPAAAEPPMAPAGLDASLWRLEPNPATGKMRSVDPLAALLRKTWRETRDALPMGKAVLADVEGMWTNTAPKMDRLAARDPAALQQFYDAFGPARAAIKERFGNTVTLWRAADPVAESGRPFTRWADREFVERLNREEYGGRRAVVSREVPVDDIVGGVFSGKAYREFLVRGRPAPSAPAAAEPPMAPAGGVELRHGFPAAPEFVRKPRTDPNLTAAEREVLGRVGTADPIRRPARERIGGIYARVVRGTYPIEKYGQRVGSANRPVFQRSGDVAMLAAGSAARAEEFLAGGGGFRWTPEGNIVRTGTPAMKDILATVRNTRGGVDALEAYEVARRAVELEGRDIRSGVPLDAARRTVAEAAPEVVAAHEQLVRLRHDARDYWAAEGGLSPEGVAAMDALNEHYVPFQRVFGREVRAQGAGRPGGVSQPVKAIKGSERQVRDVIASTEEQIARMVEAGDRNRVVRAMVEEAEGNPGAAAGFLEREAASPRAINRYASDLKRMAAEHGVELTGEAAAEIASAMGQGELFATGGRITLWRNGRLEAYRVNPELGKALSSLGPYQAPWYVRMLGLGARTLKAGVTLDPIFSIVNAWRDTLDATIQSKAKFRPGIDSAIGFWNAVMKTPAYQELRAGGLGFSNTIRGRIRSEPSAMRLVLPTTAGGKIVSKVLHPFEALADFARPFEEAARVGEGLRVRKQGGTVAEAVRAGQEITTNFQQVGMTMQGWAHMTAFLNPAIQSLDRAFRVAGGDAYAAARATGEGRARAMGRASKAGARVAALGVGAVSLPSIYFWFANRNDQEIQDLRKTNAGLIYWFFRDPTGQIRHAPKPFLWGQIFGTGVETALDRMFEKDPEAVARLGEGLWDQVSTNLYPTTLQQLEAQRRNRTPFFNTPIVPDEMVGKIEPRYQATERTGAAARAVSGAIGDVGDVVGSDLLSRSVSPARLESLVRGFGGRLGGYGIQAADKLLATGEYGPAPSMQQADIPLLGRLTARTPTTAVQPVQEFYRRLKRATEATNTLRLHDESGDADNYRRADAYAQKHQADLDAYIDLSLTAQQMADIRREQNDVRRDPSLSAREKRVQLDELTRELIELAREAVRR